MSQMTLWNAESLGIVENLKNVTFVKQTHNADDVLTAETLRLLPVTSKEGPCMKSVTGKTGAELKAYARQSSDDLKKVLVHQAVAMGGNSQFTGVAMRVSKSGRVSMTFKRVNSLRLEDYTREELEARLEALKAAEQPTIENGNAQPEPKAKAKANGKGKGKSKAAPAK